MVWDANKARESTEQINLLESIVPHDRKETALKLFHENGYQINGTFENYVSLSEVFDTIILTLPSLPRVTGISKAQSLAK